MITAEQNADRHCYDRPLDPGGDDAPAIIARRIADGARVLDVGTGTGALGRYLTREKGCSVDGVTWNPQEAEQARRDYRRVEVADLEAVLPSALFCGERYDFVVCADVLEHLRSCDAVLADLAGLLAPEGRVLVSVPNVAYVGVLAGLLSGRFPRTREGLLDATHIRLFDRQAVEELAQKAGLGVVSLTRVLRQPADTEFRFVEFDNLPPAQKAWLSGAPEAMVYEYVLEAQAGGAPAVLPAGLPGYSPLALAPAWQTQVFFDYGDGFSEQDSALALSSGAGVSELVLRGRPAAELHCLRVDFVDRPGLFELHSVALSTPSGGILWQWRGDWSSQFRLSGIDILAERGPSGGRLLMADTGDRIMAIDFAVPLALAGEAPVVSIAMTAPQDYGRTAFLWARDRVSAELARNQDALEESRQIQARLASSLQVMEEAMRRAEVDKRQLAEYIEALKTELSCEHEAHQRLREAHHQLLTSPFRRLHARLGWLVRRLRR